jgi:hypothetical protein
MMKLQREKKKAETLTRRLVADNREMGRMVTERRKLTTQVYQAFQQDSPRRVRRNAFVFAFTR